jgi:hypothetical protein
MNLGGRGPLKDSFALTLHEIYRACYPIFMRILSIFYLF